MKYLLVMNPGSRAGRGRKLWQVWDSRLRQAKADFECACTEGVGHAVDLARSSQTDVVVAVGGDGTINEVLDGVIQSGNGSLRMGVLYSGTSPDFCRFHRIPIEPTRAVAALLSGQTREVDAVSIEFRDGSGNERTAHFGCSCSIGMGATVAGFANRWRRRLGDTLGTGIGVIKAIALNMRVDLVLEIDGEARQIDSVNHLMIAKNPFIASGLRLNLDLLPDDGDLYLVAVHGKGRLGLLRTLPGFYTGSACADPSLLVTKCTSVSVRCDRRADIEFDGDPRGYLPARIEILPKALKLIGGNYE